MIVAMPAATPAATSRSGVADVKTTRRGNAQSLRTGEQRRRMRLGVRRRVSCDDRAGACRKAQQRRKRRRESFRLVGDDSPAQSARLDRIEERRHAVEQRRVDTERGRIVIEKRVAQHGIRRIPRMQVETGAEQAASAVRRVIAQPFERQRVEALVEPQPVERAREVGRGIGERAVEIEQHAVDRQRARRGSRGRFRTRITHRGRGGTPSGS
jgi:hypothetical protein